APRWAKASTICRPMPRLPPVTSVTLPVKSNGSLVTSRSLVRSRRRGTLAPIPRPAFRREETMAYTLEEFCRDAHDALKSTSGPDGREKVRVLLEKLLTNKEFVEMAVGENAPKGATKLYEDKELGFVVLGHVNKGAHKSPPHDHGSS